MWEFRLRMVAAARNGQTRVSADRMNMPNRWRPASVLDPQTGDHFTHLTAWEFVACCLENPSVVVRETIIHSIRQLKSKIAYEWVCLGPYPDQNIYIKIFPIVNGKNILGISFHPDDPR